MSGEVESRKLSDLRVVDLKSELEKRGLDKTGNKQALLERLQKALESEGVDPDTFQFESEKKFAKRLSASSSQQEGEPNQKDTSMEEELEYPAETTMANVTTEDKEVSKSDKDESIVNIDQLKLTDIQEDTKPACADETVTTSNSDEKTAEVESENKVKPDQELEPKPENEPEPELILEPETELEPEHELILDQETELEPELEPDTVDLDTKDDGISGELESPIRLTLEEEETFQDEEVDAAIDCKSDIKLDKVISEDIKNTTSKNQEHSPVELAAKMEKTEIKSEGSTTSIGDSDMVTSSKSSFKNRKALQNRNLWITNISQATRATELKQALSAYGKVIGAKVVINARYPGACCYGYVTMDTVEDANNCILKLNNTELNGQIIRVEKVRPDHVYALKLNPKLNRPIDKDERQRSKPLSPHSPVRIIEHVDLEKKEIKEEERDKDKRDEKREDIRTSKDDGHRSDTSSGRRHDSRRNSRSRDRVRDREPYRGDSKGSRPRHHERDVLTFDKIKEERERQRLRDRERIIREETRRRCEEAARQREVERRQRSEAARLDREREKLRIERERIEREKAELMRLERERQKVEREKLELEKLELERAKLRLQEEDRRVAKRSAPYRREGSYEDRKRIASDRRYEDSPPPRFDPSGVKARESSPPTKKFGSGTKDYKSRMGYDKRDSYPNKRDRDYESDRSHAPSSLPRGGPPTTMTKYDSTSVFNINRERDIRDNRSRENPSSVSSSRISKDSRYGDRDRERSPHYRQVRDDRDRRGGVPDHKGDVRSSREHRYAEPSKEGQRFDRNTGGNNWNHPSASTSKVFNTGGAPNTTPKTWTKDTWRPVESATTERWNANPGTRGTAPLSTTAFTTPSNINLGPSCPPPPAINNYPADRFDYKNMGGNVRKY